MKRPKKLSTSQIRSEFLAFFQAKEHRVVPSSSLIPGNDPSLLFTNSGMVQFKDIFLGAEKRSYARAVDVQRCLRAGGKHNDLDAVGYTARHHTFFEMLGNWSFGDYFKHEAIAWAWELLTTVWLLPPERLLVTVYHTDEQTYAIWRDQIGLPSDRIIRIGDNKGAAYSSDNFWQMAETGPCGPCTEIFYDHGDEIAGGPPGSPNEDGDRFIEIWNLVFMQYDRQPDGSLRPLPAPCVDTGMGLERIAAVLQHVHSNYDIDLFRALTCEAARLINVAADDHHALRVIADHCRASAFMIVDGIVPSNEGRGYVLRRIIRRALRHGWMLGVRTPFFHRMIAPLVVLMGEAYPELASAQKMVEQTVRQEEERFAETLDTGMRVFERLTLTSTGLIAGEDAFRLYDTYGFPLDLTTDIARERGLRVDHVGFEAAMAKQRAVARTSGKFAHASTLSSDLVARLAPTQFIGYDQVQSSSLRVLALLKEGQPVSRVQQGEECVVFLDQTPFYAESGGQVGDSGVLQSESGRFEVTTTSRFSGQFYGHVGRVTSGVLISDSLMQGTIDEKRREATALNHSATHLLHAALRHILGHHVAQKGSLVAGDRLRFDFSHPQPIDATLLEQIEREVNAVIRANLPVQTRTMDIDEALALGARALFGEKYGEQVRVLSMGHYSLELCGGTHVRSTGDIGLFKICGETGVSAGVRRIEAITGQAAIDQMIVHERTLHQVAQLLATPVQANELLAKIQAFNAYQKRLEQELDECKEQLAWQSLTVLAQQAEDVGGVKVLTARLVDFEPKRLRAAVDRLKQQLGRAIIVLAAASGDKVAIVVGVSATELDRVSALELLRHVMQAIGGQGGGRADLAQGGGDDRPELIPALKGVSAWVERRFS